MKKRYLLINLLCLGSLSVFGQQDPQFTQYMDNTLFVNPAYAGSGGMLNMTAIHREQWVGFDGRPRSSTFSLHSPLSYKSVGLGVTAVNDAIGPINQTMVYGDFSYTLQFKELKGKLAFGLKAGVNVINSRTDELTTTQTQDPNFLSNVQNRVLPNFGVGAYYHTPKWFIGVSTPKILESSYDRSSSTALERRHYFLIGGAMMNVSNRLILRPTTQLKMASGVPLSLDLSLAGIYNERFWLGVMHRLNDSFGAFIQFQITNQFKAGVAYDHSITPLTSYNKGTYELLLSYDFLLKKENLRSPRYF